MTVKKTIKMVRSGEFDLKTYGQNHCGVSSEFKIRYHMTCMCSPKLDNRGFLFDQLNIQNFFESIGRTSLSCERLTVVCLEQLLEHILEENPTCQIYNMELTLSPEPYMASMSHAWDNAKDPLTVLVDDTIKHWSEVVKTHDINKVHSPNHKHEPSHVYTFREPDDVVKSD